MFNRSAGLLFAVSVLALSRVSLSAQAADVTRVAVRAGDLDLTTDSGRAVLKQRIDAAVTQACGYPYGLSRMYGQQVYAASPAYAACSASARTQAAHSFDTLVAAAGRHKLMVNEQSRPVPVR
jgi:UrcA family protein